MTLRFYLVPSVLCERGGVEVPNSRCPKYLSGANVTFSAMDYGADPVFFVLADVTDAQHTQLTNQTDVTSIIAYANLDNNVPTAAVTAVQTGLENLNIPGNWVNDSYTWRQVLRVLIGCFQFQQRMHGMFNRTVFRDGIDLSRTWSSLATAVKDDLRDTADSFGWDYSTVTASSTLREILRMLAVQWGTAPMYIGGHEV